MAKEPIKKDGSFITNSKKTNVFMATVTIIMVLFLVFGTFVSCTTNIEDEEDESTTYTVTYNANGATSGTVPATQTKTQGVALTLANNSGSLAKTGFTFAGWNTAADGSGTDYAEAASYTTDANVTLYAKWTSSITTYTITYNANGATSGTVPATQTKTQGVALTLANNSGSLAKTGFTFAGWNTKADRSGTSYAVSASYTADENITLYAKWTGTIVGSWNLTSVIEGEETYDSSYLTAHGISMVLVANEDGTFSYTSTIYGDASGTWTGSDGNYTMTISGNDQPFTVSGDTATLGTDFTFTRVNSYTVIFDANGGTGTMTAQSIVEGGTSTLTACGFTAPTEDKAFAGWNTEADGTGTAYADGADYTMGSENVTLYAKWTESFLTFSSSASFTIATGNNTKNWNGTLEYSTDKSAWTEWGGTVSISSSSTADTEGNYNLYLRGTNNTQISGVFDSYYYPARWILTPTGTSLISCSGNIENLLDYTTVAAENHPTMDQYCYFGLFHGCTSLATAPAMPATTLSFSCCYCMFYGCTSLTTAPELPATTLANFCYYCMFDGCTSLTTAPALPATTLTNGCYAGMFLDCTSLTTAPELPAKTLAARCYEWMFDGCTEIKLSKTETGDYQTAYRIPTSGVGTSDADSLTDMFANTGGTFKGTPSINITYYTSNTIIPAN